MKTFITGLGQDSHRFEDKTSSKPCILAGLTFPDAPGFIANSDGDVILHAICNAITSLTGVVILGGEADTLCLKDGVTDSRVYLEKAIESLNGIEIVHVAISLECLQPKLKHRYDEIRTQIAKLMNLETSQIGITATTGEGLTAFGKGEGVFCSAIVSAMH